jgi:hypothetical protein
MKAIAGYDNSRRVTLACSESMYVQPEEFLSLLLSRREMVRSDAVDGEVRGLLDVVTGERFLIERAKLISR